MGISGRHEAPGNNANPWLNWLFQNGLGYGSKDSDGNYGFSYSDLYEAYNAYIASGAWTGMWNDPPPFEDWLDWFMDGSFTVGGTTLYWAPVGDVWALLVLAIAYAVFVWLRKRQLA
jgi:hypothetical protein